MVVGLAAMTAVVIVCLQEALVTPTMSARNVVPISAETAKSVAMRAVERVLSRAALVPLLPVIRVELLFVDLVLSVAMKVAALVPNQVEFVPKSSVVPNAVPAFATKEKNAAMRAAELVF